MAALCLSDTDTVRSEAHFATASSLDERISGQRFFTALEVEVLLIDLLSGSNQTDDRFLLRLIASEPFHLQLLTSSFLSVGRIADV